METYQSYKGYGIRYYEATGTTVVENCGFPLKTFRGQGESKGLELAKKYIDEM